MSLIWLVLGNIVISSELIKLAFGVCLLDLSLNVVENFAYKSRTKDILKKANREV